MSTAIFSLVQLSTKIAAAATPPRNCTTKANCPLTNSVCKQYNSDGQQAGTCACKVGYQLAQNACTRITQCKVGDNTLCKASHRNTVCAPVPFTNNTATYCKCAPSFRLAKETEESCILDVFKLNGDGSPCSEDGQCGLRAVCNPDYRVCECPPGTKADPDQVNCSPERCSQDSDCQLGGHFRHLRCNTTEGGFCYNPKLKCGISYRPMADGTGCQLFSACKVDTDCTAYHPNTYCKIYKYPKNINSTSFSDCECVKNFFPRNNGRECVLLENVAKLGAQCRALCGDNAECRWDLGGLFKRCLCKLDGFKPLADGVNCAKASCTKREDCTAVEKSWRCNATSHFCYNSSGSVGVFGNVKYTVVLAAALLLLLTLIL